jgi:drug/metabolite transporter (DMT)-like permease
MSHLTASVAAAIGSAIGYAFASVLQHRQARLAPPAAATSGPLLLYLATRPMWVAGLLLAGVALLLHALALSLGQLTVVQPVLLSGLLFALPASVLLERKRPSLAEWCWALILVGGIAAFLVASHPTADRIPTDTERLAALVAGGVGLAGGAVVVGRLRRRYAATLYGLGAGVAYGLTAALIKQVTAGAKHPVHLAESWFPYTLVVIGSAALILSQVAYRAGPLAASLPPLTMAEPVVAVIIGVTAFSERLDHRPLAVAAEMASAVVVAAATVQLARRTGGPPPPRRPGPSLSSGADVRQRRGVPPGGDGGGGAVPGQVGVQEGVGHGDDSG